MSYTHYESGEMVVDKKDPKARPRGVAFTGNAGWVYFYDGGCLHTSQLRKATRSEIEAAKKGP